MALNTGWPIIGWARTPVAPVGGALAACPPHALGTPLVQHLLAHPAIAQASVLGLPDPLRGMRVHAVLAAAPGQTLPNGLALAQWCRHTLEAYKAPRQWWLWHGPWPHTRSGKTDHARIAVQLAATAV